MSPEDYKPGKYYYSAWVLPDAHFTGIVKILEQKEGEIYDKYVFCEIIHSVNSSSKTWKKGWKFYLVPDQIKEEIDINEYPEYFI